VNLSPATPKTYVLGVAILYLIGVGCLIGSSIDFAINGKHAAYGARLWWLGLFAGVFSWIFGKGAPR
jgi:hypothetical protein